MAIFDAVSGGNPVWYGTLTASKTVDSGDELRFIIGAIVVTMQ